MSFFVWFDNVNMKLSAFVIDTLHDTHWVLRVWENSDFLHDSQQINSSIADGISYKNYSKLRKKYILGIVS